MNYRSSVEFIHDYKRLPCPEKILRKTVENIYTSRKVSVMHSVHIILCSNYTIQKLNAKFRKIAKPTDVLSFEYKESDLLGEIYISLPKAKQQAREYGSTYDQEIVRLVVHGMFHLLGYDHQTKKDREKMEKEERKFWL